MKDIDSEIEKFVESEINNLLDHTDCITIREEVLTMKFETWKDVENFMSELDRNVYQTVYDDLSDFAQRFSDNEIKEWIADYFNDDRIAKELETKSYQDMLYSALTEIEYTTLYPVMDDILRSYSEKVIKQIFLYDKFF